MEETVGAAVSSVRLAQRARQEVVSRERAEQATAIYSRVSNARTSPVNSKTHTGAELTSGGGWGNLLVVVMGQVQLLSRGSGLPMLRRRDA